MWLKNYGLIVRNIYATRFTSNTTPYTELLLPPIRESITVKIDITKSIIGRISNPKTIGMS